MLLCIGMCSARAGAEVAKVVSATPTAGESYYLYNVGTGKFLGMDARSEANLASYGLKLSVSNTEDGKYTLTVASTQKAMYASSNSYVYMDFSDGNETRKYWNFIRQEDGYYKIQCATDNQNYDANRFLGWKDSQSGEVVLDQVGTHDWAFLTQEAYEAIAYALPTQQYEFPTIPESKPASGSTYYLYNVDARGFLNATSYRKLELKEEPDPVQIELLENGAYTLRLVNRTDGYIYGWDDYCEIDRPFDSKYCYWKIEGVGDNTYMIQRSPLNTAYYDAVEYMGWQSEYNNTLVANRVKDYGTKWKLIPADEAGNRLVAQLKLYHALAKTDAYQGTGWNLSYYTDLYASRSTASLEEITKAAYNLRNGLGMSAGYIAPYWNECPIFWQTSDGSFGQSEHYTWALQRNNYTSGTYFERRFNGQSPSTLSATVDVTEASTFVYEVDGERVQIYIDDVLVRDLKGSAQASSDDYQFPRFFEELTPGKHTINFVFSGSNDCWVSLKNVGVMASPLISVNLLEPGSLGTEVLYNTDHIKNVRRLKVKGKMNDEDWAKIKMMHYLQELDLSEAEITEIPQYQFSKWNDRDTSSVFLHKMALPEGLKKIGERAFYSSLIDKLEFPSTVISVGERAFEYSHIQQLDLPDNLTDLGSEYAFADMYWLEKLKCPKNLKRIPWHTFIDCHYLEETVLPDSLEYIGELAFQHCYNMTIEAFPEKLKTIYNDAFDACYMLNPRFNDKLETIGRNAFRSNRAMTSITLPESVTTLDQYAFAYCSNLESVTISSPIWNISNNVFEGSTKLNTLRLNCPTMVGHTSNTSSYPVPVDRIANVKLVVPEHLVASYKLDSYWYNFKSIEGFSTEEIQNWRINNPLVLNRERLNGNPDIAIVGNHDRLPSLKINGENAQEINNLHFWGNMWSNDSYAGQLLSNCDNVKINGDVMTDLETGNKRWHFFCLPYDVKVSDITPLDKTAQMAVRYYDGANRAANGAAGSWKNYEEEDIIPAGTGFIMQTNKWVSNRFTSFNDTKQNVVANVEFVKTLEVNASETASNRGWNLVGNPWQCFYNDHALNFTAPITVWDTYYRTYTAYSITDDDYAIRPNEAFFVQCPNEENNTIGFPTQGRQLDAIIKSQNAVKGKAPKAGTRKLIDLVISNGDTEDRTRVVLNDEADINYDITCDAGKMMSMDSNVPQIYTLGEDNVQYAINERPMGDGLVALGYYAGRSGKLTIKLDRCRAEKVYLIDYETNETTDLTSGSYTFTTESGVNDIRFKLAFEGDDKTGITAVEKAGQTAPKVYTVDGKYVGNNIEGLKSGVYVINQSGKSHKMLVK